MKTEIFAIHPVYTNYLRTSIFYMLPKIHTVQRLMPTNCCCCLLSVFPDCTFSWFNFAINSAENYQHLLKIHPSHLEYLMHFALHLIINTFLQWMSSLCHNSVLGILLQLHRYDKRNPYSLLQMLFHSSLRLQSLRSAKNFQTRWNMQKHKQI